MSELTIRSSLSHYQSDAMDFEKDLRNLANLYARDGYQVIIAPQPEVLPDFAKRFKVEILATKEEDGVLVAVKRSHDEAAEDKTLSQNAAITNSQPGWRFDLVILGSKSRPRREVHESREFSVNDIQDTLAMSEELVDAGFLRPAVVTAWSGLEAAMRMRIRAAGDEAGWGTSPLQLMNELVSSGLLSREDFQQLQSASRIRNEIVHGFNAANSDAATVHLLTNIARRFVSDSQRAKQPA